MLYNVLYANILEPKPVVALYCIIIFQYYRAQKFV